MINANIIISGYVQGVGFRAFVMHEVEKAGNLTGWVKNIPNGRQVEVLVEGSESDVQHLIDRLKQGTSMSRVKNVEVTKKEISSRKFNEFSLTF
ncbi:acylphosphatase [Candidatus Desantisbacteria bacterium]|nr:acylphosphatase [Candidatus Desantisbacteria bacterium]